MVSMETILRQEKLSEIQLLNLILDDSNLHAIFLNTISLLEHLGSRKILLTQSNPNTTEFILRHASEEARHALFFKKKIELIHPGLNFGYNPHELLAGTSAVLYFQKLDASVRRSVRKMSISKSDKTYLNYLYTTTLIEIRATRLYKNYNEVLQNRNFNFHLNGLLAEEEGHLSEMETEIQRLDSENENRLNELLIQEEKLFSRLWKKWESFCDSSHNSN